MRKLTIKRRRTLVASLARICIYIETDDLSISDNVLSINKKNFKLVGRISNGKSLTVDIPDETVEVMITFSAKYAWKFNTGYTVTSGNEDVVLNTRPIFSPALGNPFIIEK